MNVKDLIEELQRLDPEAEVLYQYNYGDYWKTQVAEKVQLVDVGKVTYSEYHRMDKVVEVDDYDGEAGPVDESPTQRTVVLLG